MAATGLVVLLRLLPEPPPLRDALGLPMRVVSEFCAEFGGLENHLRAMNADSHAAAEHVWSASHQGKLAACPD
jgi:hypothetical protein